MEKVDNQNVLIGLANQIELSLKSENIQNALQAIEKHGTTLEHTCSDELQTVFRFLTDECSREKPEFYAGCEEVLKALCRRSNEDEILFELLEVIETTGSDNVFTTALKGFQIAILKSKSTKSRSLEWCLDSIYAYVAKLPFPDYLKFRGEDEEAHLQENDEQVSRILMMYITLFLFIEPLVDDAIVNEKSCDGFSRNTLGRSKRNVLIVFLFKLMGMPFSVLEIAENPKKSKSYTLQCGESLVETVTKLMKDPFHLLSYVDRRDFNKQDEGVERSNQQLMNVFMSPQKIPNISISIFYHLLFTQNLIPSDAPKVYTTTYLHEMGHKLATYLLCQPESAHVHKGLQLSANLIARAQPNQIPFTSYSPSINCDFITGLVRTITFNEVKRNRSQAAVVLKNYILQFDETGRYHNIRMILNNGEWKNVDGYVAILYKNIVDEWLKVDGGVELPEYYRGDKFKEIMRKVYHLPGGAQSDLVDSSDLIISALNLIRYFALRDRDNRTGFWDLKTEIETKFLSPLREGINLSTAHYEAERSRLESGGGPTTSDAEKLNVSLVGGKSVPDLSVDQKITMLGSALTTFQVMSGLLARVEECVEQRLK